MIENFLSINKMADNYATLLAVKIIDLNRKLQFAQRVLLICTQDYENKRTATEMYASQSDPTLEYYITDNIKLLRLQRAEDVAEDDMDHAREDIQSLQEQLADMEQQLLYYQQTHPPIQRTFYWENIN